MIVHRKTEVLSHKLARISNKHWPRD